MPELPEVQAHAERLDKRYAGTTLERFSPLAFTALKTATPPARDAENHDLVFVGRRGKYLLLDYGMLTFIVHLMQGGRLREEAVGKQPTKPRGGQARWLFTDGRSLLLTEAGTERRAGVWAVAGDPEGQTPLDHLGPDANDIDPPRLLTVLQEHPMRLHGLLRDQRAIAGIGRRLANEICHRAQLSPFASTGKLQLADAEALVEAIQACCNEGLAYERGRDDMSASADRPGAVHHRVGEPCPRCGDTIRSVEYVKYKVAYCPTCQTAGKTLADNTTSKFLK
ncbi:MAG: DNA-formamidopyrimidine glycosylase family protein [Acidimicrobiales bacterium]